MTIQEQLEQLEDHLRAARNLCKDLQLPKLREQIDRVMYEVPADLEEYQEEQEIRARMGKAAAKKI